MKIHTLINFHIRDGLPLVHSHKPSIILPPTTEVDNKLFLVTIESFENHVKALLRELSRGK
jgi:hypothetical protein